MKSRFNIVYSPNGQMLDLHTPESNSFPLFVYIHGGGIESGDKGDQTVFFEYLTSHGIGVASINYRMYPKAKYPDFLEDAAQAIAFLWKLKNTQGNVTSFFVGGSSAGGYI
ncbi:MAG: alpha/beta hydrolase, partial [Clostridia bacterium]|nr:alpha/beta hydrolase [Clostridia bacterium]